jgi:hypothetical protein
MTDASPLLDLAGIQISACHDALDLKKFSCGDPSLDRWITKESKIHNERNFVRLFCAHREGSSTIIGLYALSLKYESVDKLLDSEKHLVIDARNFPAIFIRCLAVARHLQRQGLGKFLLMDALVRAYNVSKNVSVFGVALTSLNENTTRLYQRYGFAVRDEVHNPTMILPIWSLWDLIDGPRWTSFSRLIKASAPPNAPRAKRSVGGFVAWIRTIAERLALMAPIAVIAPQARPAAEASPPAVIAMPGLSAGGRAAPRRLTG